ncbi:hypothetical protein ACH4SP_13660 [Streptomyces sp. NPDC021093]|uniref:hypothetical protein n=1 Tax=Streptomyces sp. NPDC021093 TaxID=3365112 RepID=UPI00379F0375
MSTVDFSATAVPQPGAAVDTLDGLKTCIEYDENSACGNSTEHFLQNEVATPLTSAVARVPSRSGTGFNDARQIGTGVWRDRILLSQTLWYKVPAGWGQQVRHDVEFANEPTVASLGTVPAAWTNRYESHPRTVPVDECSGPRHDAPLVEGRADRASDPSGESVTRADSPGAGGAGWFGTAIAAVAGGTVVVGAGAVLLATRRRTAANTTRSGS